MWVNLIKGVIRVFGEFFEVRTQVDRDLTSASRVDRRLGLNKKPWGVTVPTQHHMVGFKVLRSFYTACGESVQPL
jgi:hypothetical protein